MTETKRSFLHITEVVRAFGLRESDFSRPGGAWVYKVLGALSAVWTTADRADAVCSQRCMRSSSMTCGLRRARRRNIVSRRVFRRKRRSSTSSTRQGALLPLSRPSLWAEISMDSQPIQLPRPSHPCQRAPRRASASGRGRFAVNFGTGAVKSTSRRRTTELLLILQRLSLALNPSADPPEDLFRLLDKQLVVSNGTGRVLHLLTRVPSVLFFHVDRTTTVTSLDSFGSGNNGMQKRVFRPTSTGTEEIWLDRYWIKNRVQVKEMRDELAKLDGELEELKRQKKSVVVTEDGKDFRELVRATVRYCQNAKTEAGNPEREERQKRMLEDWEKVDKELTQAVEGACHFRSVCVLSVDTSCGTAAFDTQISDLGQRISSAFDSPDMHKIGPYRLTSFVVRNGLNGRGTAWSVVCDDEGKWWRTGDLDKKEISLDEALSDPSGLMMDAGSTLFFYSKVGEVEEEVEIPPHLKVGHFDGLLATILVSMVS